MGFDLHYGIEINTYKIKSAKIKKDARFVVMSDLHECSYGRDNCVLLNAIRRIRPQFVAIAGDMVDAEKVGDCTQTMKLLKTLNEEFPVYFGVGNHEKYLVEKKKLPEHTQKFLKGLKAASLTLMQNEIRSLEELNVNIVGLDLPLWYYRKSHPELLDTEAMELFVGKCERERYNILLAHDPDHFKVYAEWGADLVLSGHVHGGIIGLGKKRGLISPKLKLFPEYVSGRYLCGDTTMLVSRGLGNHTVNVRLFNPPELMVVELKAADSSVKDPVP